jgi:hypothetical protein
VGKTQQRVVDLGVGRVELLKPLLDGFAEVRSWSECSLRPFIQEVALVLSRLDSLQVGLV